MSHIHRIFIAAGLVLALAREGHVGVTSLKTLKVPELTERSGIIIMASPLKPCAGKQSIQFDSSISKEPMPPLERKVWRFKRTDILKNADGMDIPETLTVFEANTAAFAEGYAQAHSGGAVESPISYAYAGSLKEAKLVQEKSVLLFLVRQREAHMQPSEWLEFAATGSFEKAGKAKAIGKLLPKSDEPLPYRANPAPNPR